MPIANPSYLKYTHQALSSWQLNVFPRLVVGTATISGTPNEASYPLAQLTVTGASAGWTGGLPDNYITIARAGVVYYHGSLRRVPTSTIVYIEGSAYGNTGHSFEDALVFTNGDVITIYSVIIPFSFWSRISPESEAILKRWASDVFYEDDPSISKNDYPDPIPNLGAWQRGAVNAGTGLATLTHSASTSKIWRGSSFTVLWALPAGAALVGGYALTDATIQVTYPPGVYIIACAVTEVGGSTPARNRTGYRYVWAVDGSTRKDTSGDLSIEVVSSSHLYNEGRNMTFRFRGASLENTIYTGAPVLMTYGYEYSNDGWETVVTVPETVQSFIGYITAYTTLISDGDIQTVDVTVSNPLSAMKELGIAKQMLVVKATQNEWVYVDATIANVAYFIYYLIRFHASWAMKVHDFDADVGLTFFKRAFSTDAGSLTSSVQRAASFILGGTMGCTSDGKFLLKREPQIESDAYNATLDEAWTIDGDHVDGEVDFARAEMSRVFDVRGGFFVTGTALPVSAYIGRTNAGAPGQGISMDSASDYIALTLADGLSRIGNYRASVNAPTPDIMIELAGMQDVIDPCLPKLYRVDMPELDPMQTGLLDNRLFVARRVDQSWNVAQNGDTLVRTSITLAPVTRGVPGRVELQPGVVMPNVSIPATAFPDALTNFTANTGAYEPGWGWKFDFTVSAMGFTIGVYDTTWIAATGWRSGSNVVGPEWSRRLFITSEVVTGSNDKIRLIRVDYNATLGTGYTTGISSILAITMPVLNGTNTGEVSAPLGGIGGSFTTDIRIGFLSTGPPAVDPGGGLTFSEMRVYGVGTVPAWSNGSSIASVLSPYWESADITLDDGNKRKLVDVYDYLALPYPDIVSITITYDLTVGTYTDGSKYCIQLRHVQADGTETGIVSLSFDQVVADICEGVDCTYTWTGRLVLQGLRVKISSSYVGSAGTPDGVCRLKGVSWEVIT